MTTLINNIKELLQVRDEKLKFISGKDMAYLPTLTNAYLLIKDDIIVDYGEMKDCGYDSADKIIDATGKIVLPAWCDSHTHIVYAGNREQEFVDRIKGLSYEEIAERGGGILNSAKQLQETSEESLYEQSVERIQNVMKMGTGAIEIKSGYGLTHDAELKMLRVIKRIKANYPIRVIATFLGAHAIPRHFQNNPTGYIDQIIDKMLPEITKYELADYIDVFCEKGYFSLEQTERIIRAGRDHNLPAKIHVNQFNAFGGVALGVKYDALSVDHLEELTNNDIKVLKGSQTMPVALPGCSFFINIPYTPARQLIDAGLPLALATDFNPGSAPSGNMNFVVSTACIKMNLTPEEAINAATINGAYAMGIENDYGSISKGKKANLIMTTQVPNYNYLPYSFGDTHIDKVMVNGEII